jgi:hypothetical protein
VESYKPQIIDTAQIELSTDLKELIERLAENNHDHWALKRIREGWHYDRRGMTAIKWCARVLFLGQRSLPRRVRRFRLANLYIDLNFFAVTAYPSEPSSSFDTM